MLRRRSRTGAGASVPGDPIREIGGTLQRELPAGWSTTWVYAEMTERDGIVVMYYLDSAAGIGWITPPLALYERFRELNDAARAGHSTRPWTSATFTLHSDASFHVDFGYDPVPIGDELARGAAWKTRYLPAATWLRPGRSPSWDWLVDLVRVTAVPPGELPANWSAVPG